MRTLGQILALAMLVALPGILGAQGINSDGRDFFVGIVYPSYDAEAIKELPRHPSEYLNVSVIISSYRENDVTLSYFDTVGSEVAPQTYHVGAHRSIRVPLDVSRMRMSEPGEMAEFKSCHITAKSPVNVQYYSAGLCSGGSYLAISTGALGKNYVVQSYHDNVGGVGGGLSHENASGFALIIAAYDQTSVQITPSASTKGKHAGVFCGPGATGVPQPFSVGLKKGQCYLIKGSAVDASCNISGTTVLASRPIVVISGHENILTDASAEFPGGSDTLEARDFMIEQMLPVEYWDTTNYFSIPFVDSKPPLRGGQGDEYDVFTGVIPSLGFGGPGGSNIGINGGARKFVGVGPYQDPPASVWNWITATQFSTLNGTKFGAVQYDQRMQGSGAPFPAPSQLTIIPKSLWKRSYLFAVPFDEGLVDSSRFVNVICNRQDFLSGHLKFSHDGGPTMPVESLRIAEKYLVMPDDTSLVGMSLSIASGTYYFGGDSSVRPFVLYSYGFPFYNALNAADGINRFSFATAYANPVGFGVSSQSSGGLSAIVDTACAKWHICVHDSGSKIKSIAILDDPGGDFAQPARVFKNVSLNPSLDPARTGEIDLPGTDSIFCVDVSVDHPFDSAYAPILITDNMGYSIVLDLYRATPSAAIHTYNSQSSSSDSLVFPIIHPQDSACAGVVIVNTDFATNKSLDITSIGFANSKSQFKLTSVTPPLPFSLKPGDSASIFVCFEPLDTGRFIDTLFIQTPCATEPIILNGGGGIPLLLAGDLDFGNVPLRMLACDTLSLENVGQIPLLIIDTVFTGSQVFSWDPTNTHSLPFVLRPHQLTTVSICYDPQVYGTDTATINWITSENGLLKDSIKIWSRLKGESLDPATVGSFDEAQLELKAAIRGEQLQIGLPPAVGTVRSCELFDILGRHVFTWPWPAMYNRVGELWLSMPSVASGVYVVRISSDSSVRFARILKE